MRNCVALVMAAACGRLDFTPRIGPCSTPASVPDPLTISGRVIAFRTFTIADGVGGVRVNAFDATTGEAVGSARSEGNGQGSDADETTGLYTLSIAGGIPRRLRLELTDPGWNTTEQYTDVLGSDLTDYQSVVWSWGALGTVYGAVGLTLPSDSSMDPYGNLDITVDTCDGSGIGGAIVTIDPDPTMNRVEIPQGGSDLVEHGKITYLGTNNAPEATPGIVATNPAAVAFFVSPGTNTVTVTAPGYEFPPFDVDVHAGAYSSVIAIHPYD